MTPDDLRALKTRMEKSLIPGVCRCMKCNFIRELLAALADETRVRAHEDCHDLVCNGDRTKPRGAKMAGCSCVSRATRASEDICAAFEAGLGAVRYGGDAGWRFDEYRYPDFARAEAFAAYRARQEQISATTALSSSHTPTSATPDPRPPTYGPDNTDTGEAPTRPERRG